MSHRPGGRLQILRVLLILVAVVSWVPYAGDALRSVQQFPYQVGGIPWSIDLRHSQIRAHRYERPILVRFDGVNCVPGRRLDSRLLVDPNVVRQLQQFECATLFVDQIPFIGSASRRDRLLAQNIRLQDDFGDVSLPAFVVLPSTFDLDRDSVSERKIGEWIWYTSDATAFVNFLEEAHERSRQLEKPRTGFP